MSFCFWSILNLNKQDDIPVTIWDDEVKEGEAILTFSDNNYWDAHLENDNRDFKIKIDAAQLEWDSFDLSTYKPFVSIKSYKTGKFIIFQGKEIPIAFIENISIHENKSKLSKPIFTYPTQFFYKNKYPAPYKRECFGISPGFIKYPEKWSINIEMSSGRKIQFPIEREETLELTLNALDTAWKTGKL